MNVLFAAKSGSAWMSAPKAFNRRRRNVTKSKAELALRSSMLEVRLESN
jgi:hypothetical protein